MKDDCREVLASVEAHLSLLLEEVRTVLANTPVKNKCRRRKLINFQKTKKVLLHHDVERGQEAQTWRNR
jgi:hypothetical protein